MPVNVWKSVFDLFTRMLRTLIDHPGLKVQQVEGTTVVDAVQMTTAEAGDDPDDFVDSGITQMTGNVLSYLERLDDEFYKSLQLQDPHTPDYVARLKDEVPLVNLMQDTLAYYDGKCSLSGLEHEEAELTAKEGARVAARIVEHVHYREQSLFNTAMQNAIKRKQALNEAADASEKEATAAAAAAAADDERRAEEDEEQEEEEGDEPAAKPISAARKAANTTQAAAKAARLAHEEFAVPRAMDLRSELSSLARRVYASGTERAKTRTLLCVVYHAALHERYQEARDLLLMSHLADSIHQFDISTQILYNRALVRCGICAFQQGLLLEAHSALMELAAGSRLKELLAQGLSSNRYADRNPDQEKQERRRLVPYHMHINLELVEAVHLVCAMLLELPNLAHNAFDPRRRTSTISRSFRRLLDHFERQVFTGPPEQTRDFVMTASQMVLDGEWRQAANTLSKLPAWDLLPDPTAARNFITRQLMIEGMRAFLISSYAHFEAISLARLATRFEVSEAEAHAVVSRMLLAGELHACWDQPTATIVVQRTEPSKLQFLALQFAEKAAQFVETNERVLDTRTGSYGYKSSDHQGYDRHGRERRPWVERMERMERGDRRGGRGGGGRGGGRGGGGGAGGGGLMIDRPRSGRG